MANLLNTYKDQRAIRAAGELESVLSSLNSQLSEAQNTIDTLKPEVKTEVQADTYNITKIADLISAIQQKQNINARKQSLKTELQTIKPDLLDPDHQTQIQTVIDSI